ncbi:MAG: hypothetical protein ETSY2_12755 [Candidatus Entotheonella gemina]|uniref:Uncharacterized protein n=1 Tax=Candidatus Entotheonella gemina TaxID=1429439 RepID=W4MAE3_9BACT|nr:MAG: hypothetical protein ETSY2_12755 [Candidatus Entotheonella gemina]
MTATLLSLHPFPQTILDRVFGPFARTTDFVTVNCMEALVERSGLRQAKVFICDYDVTLTTLHHSLSLDMARALIDLLEKHQRELVILTSKWLNDIEADLKGGYKGQGVHFLSMLPQGTAVTVICRFFDQEIKKTGAKAYRYTSCEERLAVDGLDTIFDDVMKKHQESRRTTGAVFAKDEAIRCYLKGKGLSVREVIYFGDSFRIGGSDLPVLDVDGITAIQVKAAHETLEMLSRC